MRRETLTGSRIRERRSVVGLRQAELARQAGISASYLNLIEHNRRRIGGKLLVDIAGILEVEPSMLTEGAEAALIAALREAAADAGSVPAETDRIEEFAGRFPGWAEVLARAQRRIASLERAVETLSDRLTHDPHLAASVHEVLSTAAAIRSTASILAEPGELEPKWRDRFHANLNQDSLRLAESSRALVRYLDENDGGQEKRFVPQEEAERFIAANGYHFPEIESGSASPEDIVGAADQLVSDAARQIALGLLRQYETDARQLPLDRMQAAIAAHGIDPTALAREFRADLPAVFRRLAVLPEDVMPLEIGLVVCDGSGTILFRKPVTGFAMPRFGASCPLWPLFLALNRPQVPVRRCVSQLGRAAVRFDCLAVSWPIVQPGFDQDPVYRAAMVILPVASGDETGVEAQPVGSHCRVCPRQVCPARREPSILSEVF